jgi:signal transduction histidine kinase
LEFLPGGLRFVIADNGPGFDPHQINANGKIPRATGDGLPNLAVRLKQIGGHSKISSTPGEGTTVEFFVPLADPPPAVHPVSSR